MVGCKERRRLGSLYIRSFLLKAGKVLRVTLVTTLKGKLDVVTCCFVFEYTGFRVFFVCEDMYIGCY